MISETPRTVPDLTARPLEWNPPRPAISRVPYLPGLDGMRALAVVAVMVYHANHDWLPGGFIGVEVFFVISGYLITLLLIGEHEKSGRIELKQFWLRRARRLLPALFLMMTGLMVYCAIFKRDRLGEIRGDIVAGAAYVSNWYQIWVGQGYTSQASFAPLRHLWSLAVEEQFYIVWPLVMVALMRLGRRRLPDISRWLALTAVVIAVAMGVLFFGGDPASPGASWEIAGRSIAINDALYLATLTRATGLLLGAAFAMIWRPVAVMRGPLRHRGRELDVLAVVGVFGLAALAWFLQVTHEDGRGDPWLYRGGFLAVAVCTILVMAAVTHRGSAAGKAFGIPLLVYIGTRSYGLYLFHWPIYQIIRGTAGVKMSLSQFVLAMAITIPITELSYRFIETPIRRQQVGRWWRRVTEQSDPRPRQAVVLGGAALVAVVAFASFSMVRAELKPNDVEASLEANDDATTDVAALLSATTLAPAPSPTTIAAGVTPITATPGPTTPGATAAVAPTTVPSATTVAPVVLAGGELAVGDSVMKGAASPLAAAGFTVDAAESRQFASYVPIIEQMKAAGQLPDVMVVHLGTNGTINEDDAHEFFASLADVPVVLVLTIFVDRSWASGNNELIQSLEREYPNVHVGNWAALAPDCRQWATAQGLPGNCFASDGFHLSADGADYYTALISGWVEQERQAAGI